MAGASTASQLAVTAEPIGGSVAPTSSIIAAGTI
jgi:anti-sigma-K factor RskA